MSPASTAEIGHNKLNIQRIEKILESLKNKLVPYSIRIRADAGVFGLIKFMEFASREVKPSDRVLDAGAGSCPYKAYFSHAKYESTDFEDIFDKSSKGLHDFICSLESIPKPDNSYAVIINTWVLEHVEYPQRVLNEFYRILKPGGKLFLIAPQAWGIHGGQYNFFNFTKYGLESLFKNSGFTIIFIKPLGGIFWYLGRVIRIAPSYILRQHFRKDEDSVKPKPLAFLLLPFYLMAVPVCEYLIPLLFFCLDGLDERKHHTLGYACYCVKEGGSS